MCRYIIWTKIELSDSVREKIESTLILLAEDRLGSDKGDVEVFWPVARLGKGSPIISIDAEFTVGDDIGDIPPDQKRFSRFASNLILFMKTSPELMQFALSGPFAAWVKPDIGKSVYLIE